MNDPMLPGTPSIRAMPSSLAVLASRVMAFLPAGGNLSHADFTRRHRAIVYLIWVQAVGTLLFGLANHVYPPIVVAETLLIAALGGLAVVEVLAPRFRSAIATLALITTSAVIVQLSGGVTEAHFHFFVMLAVIALYQDWIPFLLAILMWPSTTAWLEPFSPTPSTATRTQSPTPGSGHSSMPLSCLVRR